MKKMKKLLLTLIVSLAMCGSIFAQYDSHWPDFYYPAFESQTPIVAAIEIDGVMVTADYEGWDALEVAFFVGDQCRGAGVAFGDYMPEVNYLYNEYVVEYGDPYPVIPGAPVYYDNPGEEFTVRMYDHIKGIEYTECTVTLLGEPFVLLTGVFNDQGFDDPENPLILHFTTPATDCKILVDASNTEWSEDFEAEGAAAYTGDIYTGVLPECWTVAEQYTGASMNEIGEQTDTLPQIYRSFNTTEGGHYSLRMHFNSLLVMPELDETVDLSKVRMSMYVRQPYWRYKLQVGIITDMDNPEESFVPVAVVNNPNKSKTYVEFGFWAVRDLVGPGRHIAFKNIGNVGTDLYSVNYMDDVTLTYVDDCEGISISDLSYSENFEGDYDGLPTATGVEPMCWDVISEDAALQSNTRPQIYRGFNKTTGGSYSLRMLNRCIYAMPVLNDDINVADLSMTFQLRQPNSVYRLQVGVVDEEGNFTVVKTLKCNSTGMEPKEVNFASLASAAASAGNRIAFRNTLVPGTGMSTDYFDYSYNYIDEIELFLTDVAKKDESGMDADADLESIDVYPNPTTGNLYIDAMGIQKVECYNQMGQLVRVYDNVVNTIDLNNLSEGVYTLRITVPQGVTMRKVVKR